MLFLQADSGAAKGIKATTETIKNEPRQQVRSLLLTCSCVNAVVALKCAKHVLNNS